jgi:hypothetical protein
MALDSSSNTIMSCRELNLKKFAVVTAQFHTSKADSNKYQREMIVSPGTIGVELMLFLTQPIIQKDSQWTVVGDANHGEATELAVSHGIPFYKSLWGDLESQMLKKSKLKIVGFDVFKKNKP